MLVLGMNSMKPAVVGSTEALALMSDPSGPMKALLAQKQPSGTNSHDSQMQTVKTLLVTMRPESEKLLREKFLTPHPSYGLF